MEVYGGGKVFGIIIRLSELEMIKQVLSIDGGGSEAERGSLTAEQALRALFMETSIARTLVNKGRVVVFLDIKPSGDDLEMRRRAHSALRFFSDRARVPFDKTIVKFV